MTASMEFKVWCIRMSVRRNRVDGLSWTIVDVCITMFGRSKLQRSLLRGRLQPSGPASSSPGRQHLCKGRNATLSLLVLVGNYIIHQLLVHQL